jgi:hypothetical protein
VRLILIATVLMLMNAGCFSVQRTTSTVVGNGKDTIAYMNGLEAVVEGLGPSTIDAHDDVINMHNSQHALRITNKSIVIDDKEYELPPKCTYVRVTISDAGIHVNVRATAMASGAAVQAEAMPTPPRSVASFPSEQVRSVIVDRFSFGIVVQTKADLPVIEIPDDVARANLEADGVLHLHAASSLLRKQTVVIPTRVNLVIKNCDAVTVGDLDGCVELTDRGMSNATLGRIGGGTIDYGGMGTVTIAAIKGGSLDVTMNGSGNVTIEAGTIDCLKLTSRGMGRFTCRAPSRRASIVSAGSGDVAIAKPESIDELEIRGMGKFRFLR